MTCSGYGGLPLSHFYWKVDKASFGWTSSFDIYLKRVCFTHFSLVIISSIDIYISSLVISWWFRNSPISFERTIWALWCWSHTSGIAKIGTFLKIASSSDCKPHWVMNSFTFGWPAFKWHEKLSHVKENLGTLIVIHHTTIFLY